MSEYLFTLEIKDIPEPVMIESHAAGWEEPVNKEKFINRLVYPVVQDYLSHVFCMHGRLFNLARHTPRQLYEALINNHDYSVTVDGIDCELPDDLTWEPSLPPGAIP